MLKNATFFTIYDKIIYIEENSELYYCIDLKE